MSDEKPVVDVVAKSFVGSSWDCPSCGAAENITYWAEPNQVDECCRCGQKCRLKIDGAAADHGEYESPSSIGWSWPLVQCSTAGPVFSILNENFTDFYPDFALLPAFMDCIDDHTNGDGKTTAKVVEQFRMFVKALSDRLDLLVPEDDPEDELMKWPDESARAMSTKPDDAKEVP